MPDDAKEIQRSEFDALARTGAFIDGPWVSSFGDGYGEPYVPLKNRTVWGMLPDGAVFAKGEVTT